MDGLKQVWIIRCRFGWSVVGLDGPMQVLIVRCRFGWSDAGMNVGENRNNFVKMFVIGSRSGCQLLC